MEARSQYRAGGVNRVFSSVAMRAGFDLPFSCAQSRTLRLFQHNVSFLEGCMVTVSWGNLKEDGFVTLDGVPFTGTAVEKYENGAVRAQNEYVNGLQHGLQRWWYADGQ